MRDGTSSGAAYHDSSHILHDVLKDYSPPQTTEVLHQTEKLVAAKDAGHIHREAMGRSLNVIDGEVQWAMRKEKLTDEVGWDPESAST